MRAHVVDHLSVDPLRRPAQRKLPQGCKIAGREIVSCGALGLLWHIDLAFVEAGDQILGRKVDQLNVAGKIDDRIRQVSRTSIFRDSGDDVVQAFDVLDVEGCIDVDPGGEQLLDIHVALGMPALRPGRRTCGVLEPPHKCCLRRGGFWSEVQRVYENRICTSLPSSLRIAWNGVLKPRHFLGVRLAVRTMSWISSSDTLSMSM